MGMRNGQAPMGPKNMFFFCFCLCFFACLFASFFFFFPLGLHRWHMEVPRLRAAAASLHHSHRYARSEPCLWPTYTAAHSNAGSLTHWKRPGIKPASSWMLVRFVSAEPRWELLFCLVWFLVLPPLLHVEVPRPEMEPKLLQWQCQILNPLCHQRTPREHL